jgi:hypothetical protein
MEPITDKLTDTRLNEETVSGFHAVAKWGYYNAIIGFTAIAVSVLGWVMKAGQETEPGQEGANLGGLLIGAGISLLLNITLLAAVNHLKKGLYAANQDTFNTGLLKLAAYFRILGIIMIILLVLFTLALLVALASKASGQL